MVIIITQSFLVQNTYLLVQLKHLTSQPPLQLRTRSAYFLLWDVSHVLTWHLKVSRGSVRSRPALRVLPGSDGWNSSRHFGTRGQEMEDSKPEGTRGRMPA